MNHLYFRFIKQQDDNVSGLSEEARKRRKGKNAVTMKFNLLNYILDTVSMVLLLNVKGFFIELTNITVKSCTTPLVYYLGIEENRQLVREWIVSKLRSLARSGTAVTCTTTATSASATATVSAVAGPSSRHAASTPPTPPPGPRQAGQPVPNICESVPQILPGVVM